MQADDLFLTSYRCELIKVENVSKRYKVYERKYHRLWEALLRKPFHKEFWALRDLNLDIPSGTTYGIIGMNGAGKSTLLKILTGTAYPTTGRVLTKGRVSSLLELGTGFHPELTGCENVIINGKLLGLTQAEIEAKLEEIRAFSELKDFFNEPVRTYSSGMYVRLAFALATAVRPSVLIIDEALSVGDAYFQQKCLAKIEEFKQRGVTILIVSHDPAAIKLLCDQVAVLDRGRIIVSGDPVECMETYNAMLARKDGDGDEYVIGERTSEGSGVVSGNNKATIDRVEITDRRGELIRAVTAGDLCRVTVEMKFNENLSNPTVGILIRDRLGYDVFGTNTAQMKFSTGSYRSGDRVSFVFEARMNVGPGDYTITAAAHSSYSHVEDCYQWVDRVLSFKVLPRDDFGFIGASMLEPTLTIDGPG